MALISYLRAGPQTFHHRTTTKTSLHAVAAVFYTDPFLLFAVFYWPFIFKSLSACAFWHLFLSRSCLGFVVRLSRWSHLGCRCLRISFCSVVVIAHGSSLLSASRPFFPWSLLLHRGSALYLLLSNGLFSSWLFWAYLLYPFFVASYGTSVAMKSVASVALECLCRLPMFLGLTTISSPVRSFFAWNKLLLSSDLLLVHPCAALVCCDCTHTFGSYRFSRVSKKVFSAAARLSLNSPYTLFGVACRYNFFLFFSIFFGLFDVFFAFRDQRNVYFCFGAPVPAE